MDQVSQKTQADLKLSKLKSLLGESTGEGTCICGFPTIIQIAPRKPVFTATTSHRQRHIFCPEIFEMYLWPRNAPSWIGSIWWRIMMEWFCRIEKRWLNPHPYSLGRHSGKSEIVIFFKFFSPISLEIVPKYFWKISQYSKRKFHMNEPKNGECWTIKNDDYHDIIIASPSSPTLSPEWKPRWSVTMIILKSISAHQCDYHNQHQQCCIPLFSFLMGRI